jgi:hypothetical protein
MPGAAMARRRPDLADGAGHVNVLGREWEIHTLIGGSLPLIVGFQIMTWNSVPRP